MACLFSASCVNGLHHESVYADETDHIWAQLSEHARTLETSQPTRGHEDDDSIPLQVELLRSLRPCAKCEEPKRYGEGFDGGYVMCAELLDGRVGDKVRAGYSIGVNGYDGWGRDISVKHGVPVYQFDCTNSWKPKCPGCDFHFYKYCVAAENGRPVDREKYKTLGELMDLNGDLGRGDAKDLVLKIDVESFEWDIFEDPSTADFLEQFSQIAIELHGVMQPAYQGGFSFMRHPSTRKRLRALKNLKRNFAVAHLHGNNNGLWSRVKVPGKEGQVYTLPNVLEVLYVRRGLGKETRCNSSPDHLPQDRRNNWLVPEFPSARLPS